MPWRKTTDNVFVNCEIDWSSRADNESPFIKNTVSGAHNPVYNQERATFLRSCHSVVTEQFIFRTVFGVNLYLFNSTNRSGKPTDQKMILFALFARSGLWTPDSTHPTRSERSVLLLLERFILLHSNLLSSFWLLFSYSLNFFFLQRSSSS